jgi:hypothetical protein
MGFTYKPRSQEDAKRRQEQQTGSKEGFLVDGITLFQSRDKENKIRVLPPTWDNPKHYGYDVWVHYKVGSDKSAYICTNSDGKNDCPLCAAKLKFQAEGKKKEADELRARKRVLTWVIDRMSDDKTPKLWTMPWTVDRDIMTNAVDEDNGNILFIDDPDQGYDVIFHKRGTGTNTEYYSVRISRNQSPIFANQKEMEVALDFIAKHPIPKVLVHYDAMHIAAVYDAKIAAGEEEEKEKDDVLPLGDKPHANYEPPSVQQEVEIHPPNMESPVAQSDEMTFDDIKELDKDKLIELVSEIEGVNEMDVDALINVVCTEYNIKKPEPVASAKSKLDDKLAKLKARKGNA